MITNQTFLTRGGAKYEWVDLEKSSPDEVAAKATKYHIHPIAVREILDKGERPRIQDFENHTFIVLQPLTRKDGKLEFGELEVVLSKEWILTFHRQPVKEIIDVRKAIDSGARASNQGPDFLFYDILSHIIDSYFELTDSYQARIDGLEETILKPGPTTILAKMLSLRRDVVKTRRILSYTRELVATMLREDFYDLDEQDERYFRDAHFQLSHLLETFETYREFLADLRDSYMSTVSLSLNEVMRKLTVVGTIALPLIVVSGIYGMNVAGLPLVADPSAGPVMIIGMVLYTLVIASYFRRVKWL